MRVPDVEYAHSGDVAIAYQVVGDGPVDLVFSPFVGNSRFAWENPHFRRFFERLASFSRLILFDKRGTGLSDRPRVLTLETQMDDIRAVLDAVGSERAALLGALQGSQLCALFAATYPERTRALIVYHPHASPAEAPSVLPPQSPEEARRRWGTREFTEEVVRTILPSFAEDESLRRWYGDYQRYAVSPSAAAEFFRMFYDTDISDVLPAIRVPTLVLYHPLRREAALGVAARVSGARAVEVRSDDLAIWANDEIPGEIERFLSGRGGSPIPETVLTTVLFTDIVGSTERAAALGDRAWAELIERHHALVRRELARHRGTEVDTAGDGFFATFDGPARAIHCAEAVLEGARELGLELRAGVHTGECELAAGKVAGIAVVIGARISALAGPGEVLASSTVKDLVAGSDIAFTERGEHELAGVPGPRHVYAASAGRGRD